MAELELTVEGPAHGGEFVARHEGRVVFVRGGITGERVRATVTDDRGKAFFRAEATEVLEASAARVPVACAAAAAGAGCCDWSHIDPEAAAGFKQQVLSEQLERVGRVDLGAAGVDLIGLAPRGWRTTTRLVAGADGRPGLRAARSSAVVPVGEGRSCAQWTPEVAAAVARCAEAGAREPGSEVLVVVGDDGQVHVASRPATRERRPRKGRDRRGRASSRRAQREKAPPWRVESGDELVRRVVGETGWELPLESFWQAHRDAAQTYTDEVARALAAVHGSTPLETVWDLYGGAGVFARAALTAAPGARVILVESSPAATAAAERAGDPRMEVVRARVDEFLGAAGEHRPDAIVLDPPRGGAGIPVMRSLAESGAEAVVHVGCDPASLARDVGALAGEGWALRSVRGIDAFGGTHHVEAIAVLTAPEK